MVPGDFIIAESFTNVYNNQRPCSIHSRLRATSYLSVSKVVKDGGQFLGVGVLALGDNGWVGIPPVYREPMKPHFSLLQVRLLQTGIKAVDLTSCPRERMLQGPIIHTQPAAHTAQDSQVEYVIAV